MTIQHLDRLRQLLEARKVAHESCDNLGCPECYDSGCIPDPAWADMLKVVRGPCSGATSSHYILHLCAVCRGIGFITRTAYWDAAPEGALWGALMEAGYTVGIPLPTLETAMEETFGNQSPNQAVVDWLIAYLEKGKLCES